MTIESVLESHRPCELLELSIVQIGLETTEIQRTKCKLLLWLGVGEERLLAGERAGDSNHGIGDHCDPGAININLWIAPDESNLQPDHPTEHSTRTH